MMIPLGSNSSPLVLHPSGLHALSFSTLHHDRGRARSDPRLETSHVGTNLARQKISKARKVKTNVPEYLEFRAPLMSPTQSFAPPAANRVFFGKLDRWKSIVPSGRSTHATGSRMGLAFHAPEIFQNRLFQHSHGQCFEQR